MPARRPRLVSVASEELEHAFAEIRRTLSLPEEYPAEAVAEAERAARAVPVDPAASGLADLRNVEFLTIDPEGSTDLDQALHLERTPSGGGVLHYAIADIPAFVEPGGDLDAETRRRGQTLYAADGSIPLHPHAIGQDAASLLPGRDRRAYVWRFELDDGARPLATTLTRAVIRSRRQWSYAEAQAAFDDGSAPPSIAELSWFGHARRDRESERGGASLNIPEVEIEVEDGGYRLRHRAIRPVEAWNAQVSLLTGMAAARIMLDGGVGILRTMPAAEPDDMAAFRAKTVAIGIPWRFGIPYGDYLGSLPGADASALAIKDAAGALFRGAGYVAFDGEPPADPVQAAVGAPYAHTTAPIRRLIDRWSLVICEALANGREVPGWARESLPQLPKLMGRAIERANRLENASVDRVEAAVLKGHEGEIFRGTVLGARDDGARVQLSRPPSAIKVPGLEAPPGSPVRVRLTSADVSTGEVAFAPVDA